MRSPLDLSFGPLDRVHTVHTVLLGSASLQLFASTDKILYKYIFHCFLFVKLYRLLRLLPAHFCTHSITQMA